MSTGCQVLLGASASEASVEECLAEMLGICFRVQPAGHPHAGQRFATALGAYFYFADDVDFEDEPAVKYSLARVQLSIYGNGPTVWYPEKEEWLKHVAMLCGWHLSRRFDDQILVLFDVQILLASYHPGV